MAETKRVIYYDQLSGNQPTNGDVIFVDNPTTGTHKMDLKSFVDAINNGFDSSIKSSGVSVSVDNYSSIITNVNDQPVNSIYTYGAGLQSKVSNLPSNKAMTIVNLAQKSTGGLGQVMLAIERNGSGDYLYFRTIGGSPAAWSSWVKVANNSDVEAVREALDNLDIETDKTLSIADKPADAKAAGDAIDDVKADLNIAEDEIFFQFPDINGVVLPPKFEVGSRYVNNGADKWADNGIRLSFAKGTFISLKAGDIVTKDATVYTFSGGYSTDNGLTFTSISNGFGPYEAPSDGIYFFNLVKANSGTWSEAEAKEGWKHLSFKRQGSMRDDVNTLLTLSTDVAKIESAIGYEYVPIEPTSYLSMIADTGLNYLGQETTDANQESSDFIPIDGLYDICRVVKNTTKYGLGSICYYNSNKGFIRRDLPGTTYDFSVYNGETVTWLNIDKTVANAKYVRFCNNDNYGFRYWVVNYGYKASQFDKYAKLPFLGKKIVNFGDSIFGSTRPPKDVSTYLAELTGATVYNCGFGGCEMSTHANADYTPFSMCNLADAIATDTWTDQETAAAISGMPSYFVETVALLKTIDFSKVDIVTISYATNDWNNGSPLDNGGDSDKSYYADALRYTLKTLLTAFPNLHVFVCTPIYRFFINASNEFVDDCTTHTNSHGKTLTDFANKTKEVADAYFVPCIDNYHIGMNRYDRSQYFNANDGTHPKSTGNYLIAQNIAKNLF